MGVSTIFLATATTQFLIFLFAVVYGIGYGGNGALLSPLTADIFGSEDIDGLFGAISFSFAISGLSSPFLAGWYYDNFETYVPVFLISGTLAVMGSLLVLWVGYKKKTLRT